MRTRPHARRGAIPTSALALLVFTAAWAAPARADEPLFGFVYTTDLLPKGGMEVEQWLTYRWQKAYDQGTRAYSNLWQGRTEFSYGVTDAFQLSAYLNYNWNTAYLSNVERQTLPAEQFAGYSFDPNRRFNAQQFAGGSLEGIWRVLSPYTDPIGLAVLVEPSFGPNLFEFETRLILQKNFLDNRLVIAFNVTLDFEYRQIPGDPDAPPELEDSKRHWDAETDLNWSIAASYRFAPGWSFGGEFINEREFSNAPTFVNAKYATNSAYYVGPTLHYGGRNFFATLTFLYQLPLGQDFANPPPGLVRGGRNYADDFEKYRLRFKVGFYF
jgi:hypothetical protein